MAGSPVAAGMWGALGRTLGSAQRQGRPELQPVKPSNCAGCGEKIKPGVAVCKNCHAILDRAKAATLGLVPDAQ